MNKKYSFLKRKRVQRRRWTMEEMAWNMKTDRVLTDAIIEFFFDLRMYILTWD